MGVCMFSMIACIGKNRELGKKGKLIFHFKEDMRFFKETTSGHKVLMGRKTWESLPFKLPNRENIVISRHQVEGADASISDISKYISDHKDDPEEIFVIGGGMVYFELLKYAKKLYLTEVDAEDKEADTFFPEFDKSEYDCKVIEKGKENDLAFVISEYTKK